MGYAGGQPSPLVIWADGIKPNGQVITDLGARLSAAWAAKLDNVDTRLTATRAGYLDRLIYLDTNDITSALSQSIAGAIATLRDSRITSARAGYLDNLNVLGGKGIRQIFIYSTNVATGEAITSGGTFVTAGGLTALDATKLVIIPLGATISNATPVTDLRACTWRVTAKSTTNLTIARDTSGPTATVAYLIIEYL